MKRLWRNVILNSLFLSLALYQLIGFCKYTCVCVKETVYTDKKERVYLCVYIQKEKKEDYSNSGCCF